MAWSPGSRTWRLGAGFQTLAGGCIAALWLVTPPTLGASGEASVLEAARRGDLGRVRALVEQHADIGVRQPDGTSVLHWAVHWGDVAVVDLLLRAGAAANVATTLDVTPLALACDIGNGAIVERLLAAGANANERPSRRPTPLMLCARRGSTDGVSRLVAAGADVNAREPLRGQTALMWAAANGHPEVVGQLIAAGADINLRSVVRRVRVNRADPNDIYSAVTGDVPEGGSTAFLMGVSGGDLASAQLLQRAGARVDETVADGTTALMIAVHSGHRELATWLLGLRANTNATGAGYTALHAAVLRGDREMVEQLLAHGARIDLPIVHGMPTIRAGSGLVLPEHLTGATAFLLAAQFLEVDLLRLLVDRGANPQLRLRDGSTALMLAAGLLSHGSLLDRRGRVATLNEPDEPAALATVRAALELGLDVNAVNHMGDTALHGAAIRGYVSVVKLLIGQGARLDTRNGNGKTPFDVADVKAKDLLTSAAGPPPARP